MLKVIEIENIKGISHKRFELDILPNKPSLLDVPNGFGKSSIAVYFNEMNKGRINLTQDNYHLENDAFPKSIYIEYRKPDLTIATLEATTITNTISDEL